MRRFTGLLNTTSKIRIPLSAPEIGGNEWKYVKDCLDTGWVSSAGFYVARFEKSVTDLLGGGHAVAAVNGTAALHAALLVAGVEKEDEVLVPALTFVATANAVTYCGARPAFMDVSEETWNMDPVKTKEFLERECLFRNGRCTNRKTRRRVRALLPVHVLGHPADMDPLRALAKQFKLALVEDACEAIGALYKGRPVGRLGDIACFSFNGNKVITAGGGGMIVTETEAWARRARYLTTQAKDDPVEYIHKEVGYNYRLTNVQAALGCAQMERLGEFLERKARIAERYRAAFKDLPGVACMPRAPWARPTHWLFTVRIRGRPSSRLVGHLAKRGVEARRLWRPLHRLPMYGRSFAYRVETADVLYDEAVSLPSSAGFSEKDQEKVVALMREFAGSR